MIGTFSNIPQSLDYSGCTYPFRCCEAARYFTDQIRDNIPSLNHRGGAATEVT